MLEAPSFENVAFSDGRGKYPEDLKVRIPLGMRNKVKRKAEEEGISAGELIRRAVLSYLADHQRT
jgi:Ribbon-helix-helix protein, copG family